MTQAIEGAIQFKLEHDPADLDPGEAAAALSELAGWRRILCRVGLLGQRPDRYEGWAFGNLSVRLPGGSGAVPFLITGTQTSGLEEIGGEHLARVESCDAAANRVSSRGRVHPSSETLSHAAVYQAAPGVRVVMHVHSPEIWSPDSELDLPRTDPAAANGTPAMAHAVARVVEAAPPGPRGALAMGGHQDGVLAWGEEAGPVAGLLLDLLARAWRP